MNDDPRQNPAYGQLQLFLDVCPIDIPYLIS